MLLITIIYDISKPFNIWHVGMHWGDSTVQNYPGTYKLWISEVINSPRFLWGKFDGGLSESDSTCIKINIPVSSHPLFPYFTKSVILDLLLLLSMGGIYAICTFFPHMNPIRRKSGYSEIDCTSTVDDDMNSSL
jgi:hypothetical protein